MKRSAIKRIRNGQRRGSVTIEMALVAPIFLALIAGMSKAGTLLETKNLLTTVAREGARLAAMDRSDLLKPGETTNQKITNDIKNFLTAAGLTGSSASVYIVDPNDHTTTMNLDSSANQLKLFELRVELPYSTIGLGSNSNLKLVSKIVFRNASATYAQ